MQRQGGCLCGKIRYEMQGEPLAVVICHCINCQKQSGSAFSINLIGMSGQISLQGALASYEDKNDAGEPVRRHFCNTCGSPIYSEILTQGDLIALKVGTLDDTSGLEPQSQVWCIRKHDWLSLGADIPEVMKNI